MPLRPRLLLSALPFLIVACGDDDEAPATPPPAPEPTVVEENLGMEAPPADPNEACARAIVVAWQGATAAPATVTRSEEEARARAEELRARIEGGADFADVARTESDAASSGPRGGLLGTYRREDFPAVHEPIRDAVFALHDHQTSEVLRAPYGYVVAQRCPVEKVHTRHILIRYQGAQRAGDDVTRTEAEAQARATELRAQLDAEGADFAAMAREHSEDGSAEDGGDIGNVGRGLLAPEYEEAAFALEPNAISQPVRTAFGFHIIQRLPDEG